METKQWLYLILAGILFLGLIAMLFVGSDITSIISTSVLLLFILFFVYFMPLLYLSYRKNELGESGTRQEEIKRRIDQAKLGTENFGDELVKKKYSDEQFKTPIILSTILVFAGFLLLFFPTNISGYEYQLNYELSYFFEEIANHASPITFGFIGAYFFSVQLVFRRYVQSDLNPQVFMFVTMRILITLILTFVISLFFLENTGDSGANGGVSIHNAYLALSFLIGIFPQVGLTWIENKISKIYDITFNRESIPLNTIQGLTMWHEVRLLEEDIENVQNLATASIEKLILATPFDVPRLMDWIDQALLIIHIGNKKEDKNEKEDGNKKEDGKEKEDENNGDVKKDGKEKKDKIAIWREAGVRTATDLLDIASVEENKEKLAIAVGSDKAKIEFIIISLTRDPNIKHLFSFWESI